MSLIWLLGKLDWVLRFTVMRESTVVLLLNSFMIKAFTVRFEGTRYLKNAFKESCLYEYIIEKL
jgi:hypothetical protein